MGIKIEQIYEKLPVSKKMRYGFLTCIGITVILMVTALIGLRNIGGLVNKMHEMPFRVSVLSNGISTELNSIGRELRGAALYKNYEAFEESINTSSENIKSEIEEIKTLYSGDQSLITEFEESLANTGSIRAIIVTEMKNGDYETATKELKEKYLPAFQDTYDKAMEIEHSAEAKAEEFVKSSNITAVVTFCLLVTMLVVGVLFALYLSKVITRLIVDPLNNLDDISKKLAEGDLDIEISEEILNKSDEFGGFAKHYNEMIRNFKLYITDISKSLKRISEKDLCVESEIEYKGNFAEIQESVANIVESLSITLDEIKQAAKQVNGGSLQVAKASQVLSEGSEEQAASIEELTESMKQINKKVEVSAEHAEDTKEITTRLSIEIDNSNKKMEEMLSSMADIETASNNIVSILGLLEDIAEQTSLLSLNASIESVKAGEMGKSFAIVAEEIKKLAGESVEAVKDTEQLILQSNKAVNNGKNIAKDTALLLKKVVKEINNTSEKVNEIATSSASQAISISEVNEGIIQISDVIQSNSAISEESAASSEELTAQAQVLESMISEFKLR